MTISRRAAVGIATAFAIVGGARAQTRWQAATPYPDGNFHTRNIRMMLEEIASALPVQLHSNASLLPMPQIKRGVLTGQVQIGEILGSAYGNEDPFFELDSIPQLVTSTEQARKLAALSRPFVEARFNRQGLAILYSVPWPPSGLYSNVPLPNVDALKGGRMRTFNVMTNRFATLLGAAPTLVQAAEIPQAFATGVVNSMVTSAATGVDSAAWDYAKVFTPIGFTRTHNVVFTQRRALDALPAGQRDALLAAGKTAEARGWILSDEAAASQQAILAQRGMTVAQPSAELLAGLKRIGDAMAEEWTTRAGEDGKKVLDTYRAA